MTRRALASGGGRTSRAIRSRTTVPSPLGGYLCVRVLRETNGTAVTVTEDETERATCALASKTGIDVCPEGGAAWASLVKLRESGFVRPDDRVVVFNTGTGLKYR